MILPSQLHNVFMRVHVSPDSNIRSLDDSQAYQFHIGPRDSKGDGQDQPGGCDERLEGDEEQHVKCFQLSRGFGNFILYLNMHYLLACPLQLVESNKKSIPFLQNI